MKYSYLVIVAAMLACTEPPPSDGSAAQNQAEEHAADIPADSVESSETNEVAAGVEENSGAAGGSIDGGLMLEDGVVIATDINGSYLQIPPGLRPVGPAKVLPNNGKPIPGDLQISLPFYGTEGSANLIAAVDCQRVIIIYVMEIEGELKLGLIAEDFACTDQGVTLAVDRFGTFQPAQLPASMFEKPDDTSVEFKGKILTVSEAAQLEPVEIPVPDVAVRQNETEATFMAEVDVADLASCLVMVRQVDDEVSTDAYFTVNTPEHTFVPARAGLYTARFRCSFKNGLETEFSPDSTPVFLHPLGKFTVTSPSDAEVLATSNPEISWAPSTNATGYDVWLAKDAADCDEPCNPGAECSLHANSASTSLTTDQLNEGVYRVCVLALGPDGKKRAAESQPTVTIDTAAPEAFAITGPANAIRNQIGFASEIIVTWSASVGAESYDVIITDSDDCEADPDIVIEDFTGTSISDFTGLTLGNDYRVCVTAKDGVGNATPASNNGFAFAYRKAWQHVSAGDHTTCGVLNTGKIFCWGSNDYLQAGNTTISTPADMNEVDLSGLPATERRFVNVDVGRTTCAVNDLGNAYCWGAGYSGQLGDNQEGGAWHHVHQPVAVDTSQIPSTTFQYAVAAPGFDTSCLLSTEGEVYCFGSKDSPSLLGFASPANVLRPTQPVMFKQAQKAEVIVHMGDKTHSKHQCFIGESGRGYCMGKEEGGASPDGKLGVGNTVGGYETNRLQEVIAVPDHKMTRICSGKSHSCAVVVDDNGPTPNGDLYCWGVNLAGQLLDGSNLQHDAPTTPIDRIGGDLTSEAVISDVACGNDHSCVLTADGNLFCGGSDANGQVGISSTMGYGYNSPQKVQFSFGEKVVQVDLGQDHSCALTDAGTLWCWGINTQRQVAASTDTKYVEPLLIPIP